LNYYISLKLSLFIPLKWKPCSYPLPALCHWPNQYCTPNCEGDIRVDA